MTVLLGANRFTPPQQKTVPKIKFSRLTLNCDPDTCPFFFVDTVADVEPDGSHFTSVLVVHLGEGEINQAATSISTKDQIQHASDYFSSKGQGSIKNGSDGARLSPARNLRRSFLRDKEFLEGLTQQHVRRLKKRPDQSADKAAEKH